MDWFQFGQFYSEFKITVMEQKEFKTQIFELYGIKFAQSGRQIIDVINYNFKIKISRRILFSGYKNS